MFSTNWSISSCCEWLSNHLLVRVKSWTTEFQLGIVLKVINFSLCDAHQQQSIAAQSRKQKIVPIFQERVFFSLWSRRRFRIFYGAGVMWWWYDTQELYYIINHCSHFCHCCFPLFLSLRAFDLSALMFRSQMVGWNIAFSPYGCGGREEQKKWECELFTVVVTHIINSL